MQQHGNVKTLFIVVNAGFSNDVIALARKAGAQGATIINARGESAIHHMFMGITIDSEKEILLCLVEESVAQRVMDTLKEKAGQDTPAHSVCFTMPVERILGLSSALPEANA